MNSKKLEITGAFSIACLLFLSVHAYYDIAQFFWDAQDYWNQALHPASGPRGYLYPLLLSPARLPLFASEGESLLAFRVLSALLYAALLTIVLPAMYVGAFGGKVSLVRRLVPCVLLAAVFPGVLIYPVSDLPALLFCWSAVAVLNTSRTSDWRKRLWLVVLAGILMGAAYNTRTIYVFSLGLMLVAVLAMPGLDKALGARARLAGAFLLGVFLITLPQIIVNQRAHDIWSPAPSPGLSLFSFQLYTGLEIQRYETTASPEAIVAGVPYIDRIGQRLLNKLDLDTSERTLGNYFSMLWDYPLDMLGVYGRHIVNGLDVRGDGRLYVTRASVTRNGVSFFNFTLLAFAVWVLLTRVKAASSSNALRNPAEGHWLSLCVLLIPVAAITPGAIETRFFLPVHLLAYCVLAFRTELPALAHQLRRRFVLIVFAFFVAASIFYAISLSTMTQ